ncbi:MAG: hypothetical protein CTY15_06860 [Methylocystis sp.]|nr:MAG: hypothetical protein CTY15_06860 [Methylocystis sp.]
MNWREPVFDYCERQSAAFWAEPLNALSNAAFLVAAGAAFLLWRRRGGGDYPALALIVVTACVGLGSFIFHTVATRGAMLLDVIPIAIFIYAYFFLTLRRLFDLNALAATAITVAFGVFSYGVDEAINGLNGSAAYLPALGALTAFATLLSAPEADEALLLRKRAAARGLAMAAGVFLISLCLRTLDRAVCPAFPLGAHFLWHLLNACVLWLLLRNAILAAPRAS